MKFINPTYKILENASNLEAIEYAARNCYGSHDKIGEGSAKQLVDKLIKSKHLAMLEFANDIVLCYRDSQDLMQIILYNSDLYKFIEVSRSGGDDYISFNFRTAYEILKQFKNYNGSIITNLKKNISIFYKDILGDDKHFWLYNNITTDFSSFDDQQKLKHISSTVELVISRSTLAQLTRHRINCSYAVNSMRYIDYGKDNLTMILPKWMNYSDFVMDQDQKSRLLLVDYCSSVEEDWLRDCVVSEASYKLARVKGLQKQQARGRLLTETATTVIVKANLKAWKHFFELRTKADADPEISRTMIPLKEEMQDKFKILL